MRATLPFFDDRGAGHEAQRAYQVGAQGKVEGAKHAGGGAGLRLWRGGSGCGNNDGLAHPLRLKYQVALDAVEAAGVKSGVSTWRKLLAETTRKKRPSAPVRI